MVLCQELSIVSFGRDRGQVWPVADPAVSLRKAACLMSVIFLLITASTVVACVFLAAFIVAARNGQFDDDTSPAVRILNEPAPKPAVPTEDGTINQRGIR